VFQQGEGLNPNKNEWKKAAGGGGKNVRPRWNKADGKSGIQKKKKGGGKATREGGMQGQTDRMGFTRKKKMGRPPKEVLKEKIKFHETKKEC